MRTAYQLVVIAVLLGGGFGLCIHYGATYDENWPHPNAETIADDPKAYDGDRILLFGVVESVDAESNRLTMVSDGELEIDVRNADVEVEPGGVVQVYGELSDGSTVQHADRVVVVNERPGDQTYKLGVSAIGGLLTAGLFLSYWRPNWRELSFEVRHG